MGKIVAPSELSIVKIELETLKLMNPKMFSKVYEFFRFMKSKNIPYRVGCLLLQGFESKKAIYISLNDERLIESVIAHLRETDPEFTKQFTKLLERHRLKGYQNIADVLFSLK